MMFQLSVHLKTSIVANAVEDVENLEREVEFDVVAVGVVEGVWLCDDDLFLCCWC